MTNVCSTLCRASGHKLAVDPDPKLSTFTFVVMADPQLGLLERYVEKRPEPYYWDRDLAWVNRAVAVINQLKPKPLFVLLCGDLVDSQPGTKYRFDQTQDLLNALAVLDPSIRVIALPGNHDVGDHPSSSDLNDYRSTWGDDYYGFTTLQTDFLVFNSQYLWSDTNCKQEYQKFEKWFQEEIDKLKHSESKVKIAFQHIPFFVDDPDEPDDYFNIPAKHRSTYLEALYNAGVRHVFTGHLHRCVSRTWTPKSATSEAENGDFFEPLHLITSSSVSVQLGSDQPGIRIVNVSHNHVVRHTYYSIEILETMLIKGEQPEFPP